MNFSFDIQDVYLRSAMSCDAFENEIQNIITQKIPTTKNDIDNLLEQYELDYSFLPQYLKDKIDEIDLIG